jgi:hypothetical protein
MAQRVSGGKVIVWRAAMDEMRARWLDLIQLAAVLAVPVIVGWWMFPNDAAKGLMAGVMAASFFWMSLWLIWVNGGLAPRLLGTWAEERTNARLRRHRNVLAVLPSYKFDRFDLDAVLVTRAAVYVVESKYKSTRSSGGILDREIKRDAERLQRNLEQFRDEMPPGVPATWLRGLIVVWGGASESVGERRVELPGGVAVKALSAGSLDAWLDGQHGKIGPDFAAQFVRDLEAQNADREQAIEAGPVLRWLARVR